MTIPEIKEILKSDSYNFLKTNEHLQNNIILLGLGGSHAYGTNNENSDLDIRGVTLNKKEEILTNLNFEQFTNVETDTVIYSFNKIIPLLSNCNPNTIELLGLKPEHYLYISPVGQELLDHSSLFLSKKAIQSFGGYATQQLYRLNQKSSHTLSQSDLEKHILKTMVSMKSDFQRKYSAFPDDNINLYIDVSPRPEYNTEIFMDINLHHYPLRDYASMWNELQNTVKQYGKIGKRNENALTHNKISKHMMHLIRLYMMCLDILEKGQIITYREKEHDLLMDIRNNKYIDKNNQPIPEFFDLVHEYEKKFDYAKENTFLPDEPDYNRINDFVMDINERVVNGTISQTKINLCDTLDDIDLDL